MLEIIIENNISPALEEYMDAVQRVLIEAMGDAKNIIAATATGEYMRDAKGEPKRRAPGDGGPLRKVTGRLARSIIGSRKDGNSPESIYELTIDSGEIRLRFGSLVPYARIHEYGGIAGRGAVIPPRPYMGPALRDEEQRIRQLFEQKLVDLAVSLGLSGNA